LEFSTSFKKIKIQKYAFDASYPLMHQFSKFFELILMLFYEKY